MNKEVSVDERRFTCHLSQSVDVKSHEHAQIFHRLMPTCLPFLFA